MPLQCPHRNIEIVGEVDDGEGLEGHVQGAPEECQHILVGVPSKILEQPARTIQVDAAENGRVDCGEVVVNARA